MKKLLTVFLLFVSGWCVGQDINFDWLHIIGDEGKNEATCIVSDSAGNIYVGGFFSNGFVLGDSSFQSNGNEDFFLAKLQSDGQMVWCIHGGGSLKDAIKDLVIRNNKLFAMGVFSGTAVFNNTSVTSAGSTDLFIAEYDLEGTLLNLHREGGIGEIVPNKMIVDNEGSLYLTGSFLSELSVSDSSVTSSGYYYFGIYNFYQNMFLIKYDSAYNYQWFKTYPGIGGGTNTEGFSLAVDSLKNLFIVAENMSDFIFEGQLVDDYFLVAKLDSIGNLVWLKEHRDDNDNTEVKTREIKLDENGYLYLSGQVWGTGIYLADSLLSETSYSDAYLAKFDTTGSLIWYRQLGNQTPPIDVHENTGYAIAIFDSIIAVAGNFSKELILDTVHMHTDGRYNIFVAKYYDNGDFVSAGQYCESCGSSVNDILINNDSITIAGYSGEDGTIGLPSILIGGFHEFYSAPSSIETTPAYSFTTLYPNPATTTLTIESTPDSYRDYSPQTIIAIYNTQGQEVSHPLSRGECASLSAGKGCVIDISQFPTGLYYLTLQSNEGVATKKFEVIR